MSSITTAGPETALSIDCRMGRGAHTLSRMKKKSRLDVELVARGIVPTRARAQSLVMARRVLVNGRHADKPGHSVEPDDVLTLEELEHPWVGRGGMKLAAAVEHFSIDLSGRVCLDVGASTGGFTDVMLTRGARIVYAVDVGHGQLDPKIRVDPRVVVREKYNARFMKPTDFEDPIDFAAIDVSFISLELILPAVFDVLAPDGRLVALIKPQFEAGRGEIEKGGIVRDVAVRGRVVEKIRRFIASAGLVEAGVIPSPIRGAEGNEEFLIYARREIIRDEVPDTFRDRPSTKTEA